MSFAVVVADTDRASISLVSGATLETEEEAREALASWWTEQPASVQAVSRAYVLDLERLAPVLVVPIVEAAPPETVGFLPEDPTRQTREAYEEPLEPTVEEPAPVEDVIAEAAVADVDAGVFVADDPEPPLPPAVAMETVEEVVADDGAMDSFIGEADETESVLEELSDEEVLEEAPEVEVAEEVLEEAPEVEVAEEVAEPAAGEAIAADAAEAEAEIEDIQAEQAGDAEVAEPATSDDEGVVDEITYYGSTGLAPVAGLAEEPESVESEADPGSAAAEVTPETVEVVAEESIVVELRAELERQGGTGPEGELIEYAAVEGEAAPVAPVDEPAAHVPAPDASEAAAEPAASWPWEIESDGEGARGAVASDAIAPAPAPAPEVREPLGALDSLVEAQAAAPVADTATAIATDDASIEPKTEATEAEAGAYEPGSLDMDTYTCDDCIYEGTCPKKGEETPATCGSFQWRAS